MLCTLDLVQNILEFLFRDKKKLSELSRLYRYEDGHILDMAAGNGDAKMVQLLLDFNMTVGPSALAHAVHYNHTDVVKVCGQHLGLIQCCRSCARVELVERALQGIGCQTQATLAEYA